MNKKIKTCLSLILLLAISGCNTNNSSSIATSSSQNINEIITGVEIAGPTTVYVGKTIRLTADVLGSNNDDVSWTTSDNTIATIDTNGNLTGLSEGEVTVRATSTKDTTKYCDCIITVTVPKATDISIFIEDNQNVDYDQSSDSYTVPLGQTFYIDTKVVQENTKTPDISYSINYPSGVESETSVLLEIVPDTTKAKVICYQVLEGLTITATGKYNDFTGQDLKSTLEINVVDKNIDKFNQVVDIVNNFKTKELSSLTSSTLKRTKTIENGNDISKVERTSTHKSFTNSTYVTNEIKTYTNDSLINNETKNYYQGSNIVNGKNYNYAFEYDNEQKIKNLFTPSSNADDISLLYDVYGKTTYGYTNLLLNLLTSSTNLYEDDIPSLSNTYIYAYATYEINTNNFKVVSSCIDEESDATYDVELTVNYTNDTLLGYNFNVEVNYGNTKLTFNEEATNLIYDTKISDSASINENYIDLNQYYATKFEINLFNGVDEEGRYDYSNVDKYGANKTNENGLVKYSTTYDKTIILKAEAITPNTANINIDHINATSSNTEQIPNVTSVGDGIFAINAKKDEDGNSKPGKATFTFTNTIGIQEQIVIEFVEATLTKVEAHFSSNINITHNKDRNVYVFDSIFAGDTTSYFMINATPDEAKYTFDIDVISGDKNGIELYQFEDGNKFTYPGFSYAIKGNKAGTYQFKIFVNGYGDIADERIFEITIDEPYSKEYIESQIVGQSYEYKGLAMIETIFTFETATKLKYVQKDLSDNSTLETVFNYHIEKGQIIIDNTQNFTSGSYYSRISEGLVYFNRDFTKLMIYIEIYSENQLANTNFFNLTEFTKIIPPVDIENIMEHINGKTYFSIDKCVEVTFNNGNGNVKYYDYEGNLLSTFTFTYSYNSNTKSLIISNTSSSSSNYVLKTSSSAFDEIDQVIELRIAYVTAYGENYPESYDIAINK